MPEPKRHALHVHMERHNTEIRKEAIFHGKMCGLSFGAKQLLQNQEKKKEWGI